MISCKKQKNNELVTGNKSESKMMVNRIKAMFKSKKVVLVASLFGALIQSSLVAAQDLPGASPTSYGVTPAGAFQYQIPIVIPTGINGVQPDIDLSFSSNNANGALGVGWGISGLGSINRCEQTFVRDGVARGVQHDDQDRFCLDGRPLVLVSGTYGAPNSEYRTEIDNFTRIVAHESGSINVNGGNSPTWFRAFAKDGTFKDYGRDADSRFVLPGTSSIANWNLGRVYDLNNNFYRVRYEPTEGLPVSIEYTHNFLNSFQAQQEIRFIYSEDREDVFHRFAFGSKIISQKRLSRVDVINQNQVIRDYSLSYEIADVSRRSRLTSVTECGLNNECFPSLEVKWQDVTPGYVEATDRRDIAPAHLIAHRALLQEIDFQDPDNNSIDGADFAILTTLEENRGEWVDVNGDGRLDQVIAVAESTSGLGNSITETFIKTDDGWENQDEWGLPFPLRGYSPAIIDPNLEVRSSVIEFGKMMDLNGDGLVDILYSSDALITAEAFSSTPNARPERLSVIQAYLNTGSGWERSNEYDPVTRLRDGVTLEIDEQLVPSDSEDQILFDYISNRSGGVGYVQTTRGSLIDLNGDGLVDWINAYSVYDVNGNTSEHQATWLNNGNGWARSTEYELPDVFVEYDNGFAIQHGEFVDVNADGLVDWVQAYKKQNQPEVINTWLNTGSGWRLDSERIFALPEPIFDNTRGMDVAPTTKRGIFVDVNGDGLQDWVRSFADDGSLSIASGSQRAIFLNTGRGWEENEQYRPPFTHIDNRGTFAISVPTMVRGMYIDINRDGLVDFVQSFRSLTGDDSLNTWVNTGVDWELQAASSPLTPEEIIFNYEDAFIEVTDASIGNSRGIRVRRGNFVDINNDGISDWVVNVETERNSADVTARPGVRATSLSPENAQDRLESITTTTGVQIRPTFEPLTARDDLYTKDLGQPSAVNARHIAPRTYVVSRIETSRPDNLLDFNTKTYQYNGLQFDYRGRGSLGFREFIETDEDRNIVNWFEYHQEFPLTGLVKRSAVMVGDKTINASQREYETIETVHSNSNVTIFPYPSRVVSSVDELQDQNSLVSTSVVESEYDSFGNLISLINEVSDANGNIESSTLTTSRFNSPIISSTQWVLDRASETSVVSSKPGLPSITNLTEFSYDSNNRIESINRQPRSNASLNKVNTYSYDSYGNVVSESIRTSGQTRDSQTSYDPLTHRLPVSVTNAKGQVSQIGYGLVCDQPSITTDPNGLSTLYEYDNFCREINVTTVDGVENTTEYVHINDSFSSCGQNCQTEPTLMTRTTRTGETPITIYFNAFNQPMVTESLGFDLETILQVNEYDMFGRSLRASLPFFENDTRYFNQFEYDVLDRLTLTTLPYFDDNGRLATVSADYLVDSFGRRAVATTDTKGRISTVFANALGEQVEIRDVSGDSIRYNYDVKGSITSTVDPDGNTIRVGYDILNRRTSLNDPDLGLTTYVYNGFDETVSETDAKQNTIEYEYDELGRLVRQIVPDVAGSNSGGVSSWTYDLGDNAVGQLSSVIGVNGYQRIYGYDQIGRLSTDTSIVRGRSYQQSYTYDANGYLATKNYPDSGDGNAFSVHFNYINGFLSTVTDRANDIAGCIEHWRADRYDALGRISNDTIGKIIATVRDYDPAQGVLNKIESNATFGIQESLQNLNYSYDAANNLLSRSDDVLFSSETFEYDLRDRLRFHHNESNTTEVRYDAIGNITYKSDVGTYNYSSTRPHAVSSVDLPFLEGANAGRFNVQWDLGEQQFIRALPTIHGQTFKYDENGNTLQSGNRSLFWTAFNKPYLQLSQLANGNQTGSYIEYDAGQQRVYKEEGVYNSTGQLTGRRGNTVYIGSDYERITDSSGNVTHRYTISAGTNNIQIDRADNSSFDQARYLLGDNLGSTNVVVNALGEVVQRLEFDPWGKRLNTGGDTSVNEFTNIGFTGQEMDDETGLINMNARIYDPYLGRFLSADPVLPDATDLQQFNRYSYTSNNPLKFTDPTGNTQTAVSVIGTPGLNTTPTVTTTTITTTFTSTTGGGLTFSGGFGGSFGGSSFGGFNDDFGEGGGFFDFGVGFEPTVTTTTTITVVHVIVNFSSGTGAGGSGVDQSISTQGLSSRCNSAAECQRDFVFEQSIFDKIGARLPTIPRNVEDFIYGASDAASGGLSTIISDYIHGGDIESRRGTGAFIVGENISSINPRGIIQNIGKRIFRKGTQEAAEETVEEIAEESVEEALERAARQRDELADSLGDLPGKKRPATVSGGVNTRTGDVTAQACGGGPNRCAEDNIVDVLGGNPDEIIFTRAVRPRNTGAPFTEVAVCPRCQGKFGKDPFPEGTTFRTETNLPNSQLDPVVGP